MPLITPPTQGFGQIDVSDFVINGTNATVALGDSVMNALIKRTVSGASNVTINVTDPYRTVLQSGIFVYGSNMTVDGLEFTAVQMTKASDTIQMIFEAKYVAALRQQKGLQVTSQSVDLPGFVATLVAQVPGLGFISEQTPLASAVSIGRGTTNDPNEDSWTCIQRVATSAGWRCFEVNGTIFLGSDQFFLQVASQGTLIEKTQFIQNIDFDIDIGKPAGNATVTGITQNWGYPPGAVVWMSGMGPGDGQPWLVQDCQRDLFHPQMTATLYVPMTPQEVVLGRPTAAPFS